MSDKKNNPSILDRPTARPLRARDAIVVIFVTVILLAILKGNSVTRVGDTLKPGVQRDVVLAVGHPAGWIADLFGVDDDVGKLTASLSPDQSLSGGGGFDDPATAGADSSAVAPLTPDAFDPSMLGEKTTPIPKLSTVLVTGDSLSQPLDVELAQRLASKGVKTIRDPHLGTGISNTDLLDWGQLSQQQVKKDKPDAIVFFLGANEGFPLPKGKGKSAACCGPLWASLYATRVRKMMATYRQGRNNRVYWLTLPMPRDAERQKIARAVNATIIAAAQPYRAQVRVVDMGFFTPGGKYRASMPVNGKDTLVRKPDGIHLNEDGAAVAADVVMDRLKTDYTSVR
ncbi:GDSL-type esterase/lipase family protein [Patulibacter sp. NPDC049589]|uniref:DUF459 domain-containing protein n=1 Tax=Patulibacter sp. NPDC049589 TaxID=3154731 RepID=UPI003428F471